MALGATDRISSWMLDVAAGTRLGSVIYLTVTWDSRLLQLMLKCFRDCSLDLRADLSRDLSSNSSAIDLFTLGGAGDLGFDVLLDSIGQSVLGLIYQHDNQLERETYLFEQY